jgi:RNA polymerase sigma-70 factor, ECF subfamily
VTEDGASEASRAAEAAARRSYGKLVAFLAHRTRDVAAAEDALSDAFAAALADWPTSGIPSNPEAWLIAVARRKATDAERRQRRGSDAGDHLRLVAEELAESALDQTQIPDHRLALIFACAHPAIDAGIRAPLILQTVLGFDAASIGSAFLVAPATMSQRLVRAKAKIREAGVPFRVPEHAQLRERIEAVLEAIYAAFAEGWSDPAGTEARRRNLADEAIWLGRLVASLLPEEPEALGLLALMLFAEARRASRRNAAGDYVPLADQDPALWDERLIEQAEAALLRASRIGAVGRYQLEAAVQSAHVVRRGAGSSDWAAIERLYDALAAVTGSPVVAINRAVAAAEARGAAAGLAILDAVAADARLAAYQPYWAARAELLARSGDVAGAEASYQLAIGLESDPAVRRYLQERRTTLHARARD